MWRERERYIVKSYCNVIVYGENYYESYYLENIRELDQIDRKDHKVWIDLYNLDDEKIKDVVNYFSINDFTQMDLLEFNKMSKYERYRDYLYMTFKMVNLDIEEFKELEDTNIAFILFKEKIITFRETEEDYIEDVKKSLRILNDPKINYVSYVAYIIIENILDKYYDSLEEIGEYIDYLEDELMLNPNKKILNLIYELKRNFIFVRKSLWSTRNMINDLLLDDEMEIDSRANYYIKFVYNDIIQIIDLIETYREICSGMLDTYLSSIGNKTNDVMKILTLVSTIFTPISFYASLYMMNMPTNLSYLVFWGLTVATVLFMLSYFRKKGWF